MTAGTRAVFISYASQDAEPARRIAEALRAAGIEVWFDQSELRGGEAWDQTIRQRIRDCALFVPVISANTASRPEGYFRLEWALADHRSQMFARNRSFIVPVAVDATPPAAGDVPESFERVQWTRLPGGETPPAFAQRIAALLGASPVIPEAATAPHAAGIPATPPAATPTPSRAPAAGARRLPWPALAAGAAAVLAAMLLLLYLHPWRPAVPAAGAIARPQGAIEKSVAVLPFTDMSERHDQEYFSDGLAEELIDALTQIPELRVPARTSSFSFKGKAATVGEIGRALNVGHVLEGSVRKSGDHLRITAQLVRTDTGYHLWSQTYDRDVRDVFAVQDDIAHAVAAQLKLTLLGAGSPATRQTTNIEAHNLYLQALYLTNRDTIPDLEQALTLFERALKLDPQYAPGWAGLAYCQIRRISNGLETTGSGFAKASAAAQRAIELDPKLVDGYTTLAVAKMQYERDWKAAADALARADAIDPNNAFALQTHGHLASVVGHISDSIGYFRRSADVDPLNLLNRKYLGRALHYARRTPEAAAVLREAIALDEKYPGLHYELGRTLLLDGDVQGAVAAFEAEPEENWRRFGLPLGYFAAHRTAEAQAALEDLLTHAAGSEFQVAETYGYFGEVDKAFEWLDRTLSEHDPGVIWLRRDALLTPLERDPRYGPYLKRAGMLPVGKDD